MNVLNNPQKMSPSLYLNLEEFDYGDKKILWVYVPVSSQIELCGGRIYDRNNDADQDITTSSDLVSNISLHIHNAFWINTYYPALVVFCLFNS